MRSEFRLALFAHVASLLPSQGVSRIDPPVAQRADQAGFLAP